MMNSLAWALFLLGCLAFITFADNTVCASPALDWYMTAVGETPCRTYERVRQICNTDYQVPILRPTAPGDQCDDSNKLCCCNSVAWNLSMLCLNCQRWKKPAGDFHIDAPEGSYQQYQKSGEGTCTDTVPLVNLNFPTDTQSSLCREKIRIPLAVYKSFWDNGEWYYGWTQDHTIEDTNTKGADAFFPCSTLSSSNSSTDLPPEPRVTTDVNDSKNGSKPTNIGVIVGAAIGGVVISLACTLVFWLLKRHIRHHKISTEIPIETARPFTVSLNEDGRLPGADQHCSDRKLRTKGSSSPHRGVGFNRTRNGDGRQFNNGQVSNRNSTGSVPPSYRG